MSFAGDVLVCEVQTRDHEPWEEVMQLVTEGPWPKGLGIRPKLIDRQGQKRRWVLTRRQLVKLAELTAGHLATPAESASEATHDAGSEATSKPNSPAAKLNPATPEKGSQ